ncbi:tetratricopeptide repeat protein [Streptomyces sp. MA15]|uniref:tetratricopeptide repeat protein n=1 Tax=Streptomyces sp. MA15 TaxID=3055061 RepID=UPI0025AEF979|nr:tetratricopeptide repeat protein [Streptomyces sp. MA15]MDN3268548.1 tetratricopeptide repeat protein [Streptomyces sp. MA15]
MSRLSREKKREQQQATDAAHRAPVPVDVRVPADGSGGPGALVDGVRVIAGPGEEIQQAVLNRLHRIAVASGRAVHATVRDERIGYVVPLRVAPDGSSTFTAQPVQLHGPLARGEASPGTPAPRSPAPGTPPPGIPPAPETPLRPTPEREHAAPRSSASGTDTDRTTHLFRPVPESEAPQALRHPPAPEGPATADAGEGPGSQAAPDRFRSGPEAPPAPGSAPEQEAPDTSAPVPEPEAQAASPAPGASDTPTAPGAVAAPHAPEPGTPAPPAPVREATPAFPVRPIPGTEASFDSPPTFRLRKVTPPPSAGGAPPGTVAPPLGVFGPPPDMNARPHPGEGRDTAPEPGLAAALDAAPDPRPVPPRGFDAVAEAVLGDEPAAPAGSPLADPMERISDAVRAGRIDTAARLAHDTLEHASRTLGAEHPEVLRLRELTAYIAYLAGEPLRAFRLSLDLAVVCRRAGDAEAAYGNVRSAATAWRGVRDPLLGLELGRELTALWTELAAEGGPAADEAEELDSVRARMDRLTARARGPQN